MRSFTEMGTTGPSLAFEKWSGHERSKTFASAEGTSRERAREGAFPPLVRGPGVRGISPEKILYFRTSLETILMHFETIFET